jgi:hypothetical protein
VVLLIGRVRKSVTGELTARRAHEKGADQR